MEPVSIVDVLTSRVASRMLFVGEGNFSFSTSLAKKGHLANMKTVVATCFEPEPVSSLAAENVHRLKDAGVSVMFNVDATKMHELFSSSKFDLIVFMFPHVGGKMRIEKNRKLLRDFCQSADQVIHHTGRLVIVLCSGQGGTRLDTTQRPTTADTWQVTTMATYGKFLLHNVSSVHFRDVPKYVSHGYRSQTKEFGTEHAMAHMFSLDQLREEYLRESTEPFLTDKCRWLKNMKSVRALKGLNARFQGSESVGPTVLSVHGQDEVMLDVTFDVIPVIRFKRKSDFSKRPFEVLLYVNNASNLFRDLPQMESDHPRFSLLNAESLIDDGGPEWRAAWTPMVNVCPPEYDHDISFWMEKGEVSTDEVIELVWKYCGDFVVGLAVLDSGHRREADGSVSMTLRLRYKCYRFAMSPDLAYQLHRQYLGGKLAADLGVAIR